MTDPKSDSRLQLDIRGLPEGIKFKLKILAIEADVPLTEYIRRLLINAAGEPAELVHYRRDYTPVT